MAVQPVTEWSTGLLSCCDNCSSCKGLSQLNEHLFSFPVKSLLKAACFSRLLRVLVLPLPRLHGVRDGWGEPLSPIVWHVQPRHTVFLWGAAVYSSCSPVLEGRNPAQIWHQGKGRARPMPELLEIKLNLLKRFLQGSYCRDIVTSCFCVWCSWCQMHRELKYRKKNPTVVNMQPTSAK